MTELYEVDPISQVAARFIHALQMVTELVPLTDSSDISEVQRIAYLESWFLNQRVLIEFLILRPPRNCYAAKELIPGWRPSSVERTERLKADYGFASECFAHIGKPNRKSGMENVTPRALQIKASSLLEVADEFVHALKSCGHALAEIFEDGMTRARNNIQSSLVVTTPSAQGTKSGKCIP